RELEQRIEGLPLDLAVVNGPSLTVVSGPSEPLSAFVEALRSEGIEAREIPIDVAAHSRMLDSILERFERHVASLRLAPPKIPIISNRTGEMLSDESALSPRYWAEHLRNTVKFHDCLSRAVAIPGYVLIECGPGRVLTSLASARGDLDRNALIPSLPHGDSGDDAQEHFLTALGRAHAAGLPVDVEHLFSRGHRVP